MTSVRSRGFEFPLSSCDHSSHWLSDYSNKKVAKAFRYDTYATGLALDEIPKELPGCLDLKRLLGCTTLRCAEEAIKDLIYENRVASFWQPRDLGSTILTQEEHTDHVQTLKEAGVISFERAGLYHWTRYFPVMKTNGLARAIFDCRQFNDCCTDAPYLNLLRIDVLLNMLSAEGWPVLFMHQFDLRHNFYQLSISEELSKHFGIQCGGIVGRCAVAPMGWKRSPYCCLSINYAMCITGLRKGLHVGIPDPSNLSPPAFLEIMSAGGERVGFLFVWYDNICIMCKDPDIGEKWVDHVRSQLKRFRAFIKQDEASPIFLGLQFATSDCHLFWKHADLNRYENTYVSYDCTRREIAHAAGIVLWDKAVSGIPWWDIKEVLKATQAVGREALTRKSWNEVFPLHPTQEGAINRGVARVLKGQWYTRQQKQRDVIMMASDASLTTTAFVLLGDETADCVISSELASEPSRIYLLELHAASMAIQFAATHYKGRRLYLAVDNKGVFHALRKGFTLVPEAEREFDLIQAALSLGEVELIPVFVPGVCNVADSPTRAKRLSRRRLRDTLAYIHAIQKGAVAWRKNAEESDSEGDSDADEVV